MADDSRDDHAYFLAIEEIFIGLRGAPLLLSPADYRVARRWREAGVPLRLVRRALEELFESRRARGTEGRINSLSYCAPAVDRAWREARRAGAAGVSGEAEPIELSGRLERLAAAIPRDVPKGRQVAAAVEALAGDPAQVEERLAELDRKLLDAAIGGLAQEEAAALEREAQRRLRELAGRLPEAEMRASRQRLQRQLLRRRLRLPVLSLFSPEARGPRQDG